MNLHFTYDTNTNINDKKTINTGRVKITIIIIQKM